MLPITDPGERRQAPPTLDRPLLEVHGASKRFGGVVANHAVSLVVATGDRVAVIGPNGCGKTTLLDGICGQQPIDGGRIVFDGQLLNGLPVASIARLGIIRTFQQTGVYEGLTTLHNVLASVSRAGETLRSLSWRHDSATVDEALQCLDFVGLAAARDQPAGELSYGQRKLLELAMALVSRPRMMVLDEPTAGISPAMLPEVVAHVRRANEELGITLLFVEHDMQVVAALARRVHCLVQGRLVASGSPDEVCADPRVLEVYLGAA